MFYLAYGNKPGNWSVENLSIMLTHAKENNLDIRTWINEESQLILFVIADTKTGENTGSDLYLKMKGNFDSYGLASQYEFELWGVLIDAQIEDYHTYYRIYGSYPPLPDKREREK